MSQQEIVTIPFVDMDGITPAALALAEVCFEHGAPNERDAQLRPIIEAVSEWVGETDEGRAVYEASCDDLNIGDLAAHVGAKPTPALAERLARRGVTIRSIWATGTPDPVDFDTLLAVCAPSSV